MALVIGVCALSFSRPTFAAIYTLLVLGGLALSLLGDVLLIFQTNPRAFLAGLVAFLFAHLLYIAAFAHVQSWSDALIPASDEAIRAIGLALAAGAVYWIMSPGLGKMRLPVIGYIVVISIMAHRALAVSIVYPGRVLPGSTLIVAGAFLFYLSDAILGINKFRFDGQLLHGRLLNLSMYYAGQLLLALSASFV